MSPHMVALLLLSAIAPLSAQNLASTSRSSEVGCNAELLDGTREQGFTEDAALPGDYQVPVVAKAQGNLPAAEPVYADQDALTLDSRASGQQKLDSVVDLSILRSPSPYRKVMVSTSIQPSDVSENNLQNGLALISAVYRESGKKELGSDCTAVSLAVEQRIKLDVSKVLEVVESEVGANPSCSCEIVKTSIKASDADVEKVVAIVETAITVAPETMRIVSQCAIAAMPESVSAVQALLARLDPNSGDAEADSSKSAKSAKGAKVAAVASAPPTANPLDLPPAYPPIMPPPIIPQPVTEVNPCVGYNY
ncbi:MAG: hypothetical protein V4584_04915 [Verrucomicrobiota bacterium]